MREFIDVTGKTEDEAIAKALEQLGLDRDDVSVEILERAKSGFLGLGSCPAKVRVTYGPEEEEAPAAPVREEPEAVQLPKAEMSREREKKAEKRTEKKEKPVRRQEPAAPAVPAEKTGSVRVCGPVSSRQKPLISSCVSESFCCAIRSSNCFFRIRPQKFTITPMHS